MFKAFQGPGNQAWPLSRTAIPSPSILTYSQKSKEENLLSTACSWGPGWSEAKGPAKAELAREEMLLTKTKAVSDTGGLDTSQLRALDTILHKRDSNKIGKLNSFVPDTMVAVETTARATSRAKVTGGHGSGKTGRKEARLSS